MKIPARVWKRVVRAILNKALEVLSEEESKEVVKTPSIFTTLKVPLKKLDPAKTLIENAGVLVSTLEKSSSSVYIIDAEPEIGGWYELKLTRYSDGKPASIRIEKGHYVGKAQNEVFYNLVCTVALWPTNESTKLNCGFAMADGSSALIAEELSRNDRKDLIRVVEWILKNWSVMD